MSKKLKLNLKEKLDDDKLDLGMCQLETVPVKEIVNIIFKLSFISKKTLFLYLNRDGSILP